MSRTPAPTPPFRRRPLTRPRVVKAAIHIADKKGIDALSMRVLAARLKVEAMSLYNHVAGKEDLLDAMLDAVVGEVGLPGANLAWQDWMRARAQAMRAMLLRHPWAPLLIVSRVNTGPSMLRLIDATLGCLLGAGFSPALADRAWNAIDCHIYGFTLRELLFPFRPEEYRAAAAAYIPMIRAETYPHFYKLSLMVAEGRHDGLQDFAFGLDFILEGLEEVRTKAGPQ